jgi:hypothetical protein
MTNQILLSMFATLLLLQGPVLAQAPTVVPQKGQSQEQQANDKTACQKAASEETGVNPSAQAAPPPPGEIVRPRAARMEERQGAAQKQGAMKAYENAYSVCLQKRGYVVEAP